MNNEIKISDKELFSISPVSIDFKLNYLTGSTYYDFNFSGETKRGGANNVLLYLDNKSLKRWIYWYENILKQKYLSPPQFSLTSQTSSPNINERLMFGGSTEIIVITKINHKNKITMKITNLVKKILDKDTRTLVSAGFLNGDLALTDDGVSELLGIVFLEKKAELVKIAEEKIADEKDSR